MTLADTQRGDRVSIVALRITGAERRRLMDLGFVPGTELRVGIRSPLGDPVAYHLRGSVVALRAAQAALIEVEPCS